MRNLATTIALTIIISGSSFALTPEQKAAYFKYGFIPVYKKDNKTLRGAYSIKFAPGSSFVTQDAKKTTKESVKLMTQLMKLSFWKDEVAGDIYNGFKYTRKNFRDGIGAIPGDFRETLRKNRESRGGFGHIAGSAYNWTKFGSGCFGKTMRSAWGLGAGATWATTIPTLRVASAPIGFVAGTSIGGLVVPMLRYTWNGTAWALTQASDEPSENQMFVEFKNPHYLKYYFTSKDTELPEWLEPQEN